MSKDAINAGVTSSKIKFCDLRCEHAEFPRQEHMDGANSCRTFAALWCRELQQIVSKNAPCAVLYGKRRPKSTL
ncbi:hypothetical protein EH223_12230 [candidate division KSB1 bacterium]|nr:hypothetical protein [candidate division KSB1 bacterium]RQW02593.1 MAG: hypothetical protein EH223_12230 [candidate division KSB1 bacterium]